MKIYVASSWRNTYQPDVVRVLSDELGHYVYDFKNPRPGDNGFHWSEIDKNWKTWEPEAFAEGLEHPIADAGFQSDFSAMQWADACVLVYPCGNSAHIEAGWMKGSGKQLHVFIPELREPELMIKIADSIITSFDALRETFERDDNK